jgi:hypothetical protein
MDWSKQEVRLIVEDYFDMLKKELVDASFSKTQHRKLLLPKLNNRPNGSVEFKHQNISAVLIEMGLPFIKGYKPKFNYQGLLVEEINRYLNNHQSIFEFEFEHFVKQGGIKNISADFDFQHFLSEEPVISKIPNNAPVFKPSKVNFLEREQNNRSIGAEGEKLVFEYEKWRLSKEGKENLADKVEWVSKEKGDGAGFDILSKNINGTDRYIEVKSTKLSKESPFFLSANELMFASSKGKDFFLYRVYHLHSNPKFFFKNGMYESFTVLKPETYKAYFK